MSDNFSVDKPVTDNSLAICDNVYKCFFNNSVVGQSITFPSGQMYVNQAFCMMLDYSEEELKNKKWQDITYPEDIKASQKIIDSLISKEKESALLIKRYIKKDGSILWAEVYIALCNCIPQNSLLVITTVIDITDRVRTESLLERSKNLFNTFIDSSKDLVFLKDENLRIIMANKCFADFHGMQVKDLIGKTENDILNLQPADKFRKTDEETLKRNTTITFIQNVDDKTYEVRKFPVSIGDGKTGVGAHIKDITSEYNQQAIINKISEKNRIIAKCMLKPFTNIQEQLDYALREAIRLTDSQYGYAYFYDEKTKEFTLNSWTNGVMDDCSVIDKQTKYHLDKTGLWGEVVRQRKAIIVNDFDMPNKLRKGYPNGHVKIRNFMSIPIFENKKIVAVIGFANKNTDYTKNDIYTMTVLMSGVWIATKKREKEKETELLLERTQSMINNHNAVMLLLEPSSGKIIEANTAATTFYGYSKDELLNMTIQDISMLSEDVVGKLRSQSQYKEQKCFTFPHRLKNGETRAVDVYSSPINYNGNKVLFAIIFDVTKREEVTRQNEYLAYHDYLTGIYNRRFFEEEFIRRNDGDDYPIAIIMGDVNGLKLNNDTFGHLKGDAALKDITNKTKQYINAKDIFARLGGDEFAVLVSNSDENSIRKYMDQVELYVNHNDENKGLNSLTISFGYGIQRKKEDTLDVLMKEAEAFMYNRKYYSSRSTRSKTVNVIMDTLFAKSERERNHSERVGVICEAIATKLQWDRQLIDKIRVAGFLHDIGKIGIEEEILNKNGKLDKNEWEIMKLHPAKGARIFENTVEFKEIADIVLSHHEHYDGTGYPSGLKGKEIPVEARIIAVADAYDAMTNERSYRKAMNTEAAINELSKYSGSQFDPEIVSVFINKVLLDRELSNNGSFYGSCR